MEIIYDNIKECLHYHIHLIAAAPQYGMQDQKYILVLGIINYYIVW